MRSIYVIFFLAAGLADATGRQSDTLNARDIFWSSADLAGKQPQTGATAKATTKKVTVTTAPTQTKTTASTKGSPGSSHTAQVNGQLGLRYTVLKALPGGGQMAVLPDTTFKAHDEIRVSVESNKSGYLYIIQQGSSGTWSPLYPSQGEQHAVEPGKEYIVPSEGGSFMFDEHAGQERLFILLSEAPVEDLESLIKQAQGGNATKSADHAITDVINTIQLGSRDLVFTKANKDAPAAGEKEQDAAMYVVSKNPDSSKLVVDMVLKHQ